jgi:hypothetical protein
LTVFRQNVLVLVGCESEPEMGRRLLVILAALGLALTAVWSVPVSASASVSVSSSAVSSTLVNSSAAGEQVTRLDTSGNAVDAHDGSIMRFGDTYYLYGTSYDCGFVWQNPGSRFCGFKVYSSPDLTHWTDRGFLFDANTDFWQAPCGHGAGCFRPHVIYDRQTDRYVLWFNGSSSSGFYTLTAPRPAGPFTDPAVPTLAVSGGNGDENLFVDDDGSAYVVYTNWSRQGDLIVEQLSADDRSGTGQHADLLTSSTEAPAMFKRQSRYYITYSDPNCGYCGGTGTSYAWATSPLGRWTGAGVKTIPDQWWQIQNGALRVTGGDIGLSNAGASWTDYTDSFDTSPLQTGGGGAYAQIGWAFRATDTTDGYVWLLSNYPYTAAHAPGYLAKVVFKAGQAVSIQAVPLSFAVTAGNWYHVATTVAGDTITTSVNGQVVDRSTDTSYAGGRIGFRESADESGLFDNVHVTAPDGSVLLADDFSGDMAQWQRPPTQRLQGFPISSTSCAGQPTGVTTLPSSNGSIYLYQSDRWNSGDRNEALANFYWGQLGFDRQGHINPIACAPAVTVDLAGAHQGSNQTPAGLDQSSGNDGFWTRCDITSSGQRMQTFTAGQTGTLAAVQLAIYKQGAPDTSGTPGPLPNAPLNLDLVSIGADGSPGQILASASVQPDTLGWSPRNITLPLTATVHAGHRYAILLHTQTSQGCYGLLHNDQNPYPAGAELHSDDHGTTWQPDADGNQDLHFATIMSP